MRVSKSSYPNSSAGISRHFIVRKIRNKNYAFVVVLSNFIVDVDRKIYNSYTINSSYWFRPIMRYVTRYKKIITSQVI